MRLAVVGVALVALAAGCRPPEAPETSSAQKGPIVVGNANNLYLLTLGDWGEGAAFSYRQRDAAGAWHTAGIGEGTVAAAAAWGEHVLVFFTSGRYGLFGLESPVIRPSPVPGWTPAAAAEDGAAVDVFGWAGDEPTYARWEGGAWSVQKMTLALKKGSVRDPCVVRCRGRLFLAWREEVPALGRAEPMWRLGFAWYDGEGWKGPYPTPGQPGLAMASAPQMAATTDTLLCLYQAPAEEGRPAAWALAVYSTGDENWHENVRFGEIPLGEPLSLARWRDGFCVATMRGGRPWVAPLEGQPLAIGPFQPVDFAESGEWLPLGNLSGFLITMLLVVMLLVVSRRHGRAMREASGLQTLPIVKQAAPLGRRIVAGVVDQALVMMLLTGGLLYLRPDLYHRLAAFKILSYDQMAILGFARFVLTVVYFTLSEGLAGRSLGKRLMGLEVRTLGGARSRLGGAFVRNGARVVDEIPFLFYGVALVSILIGPLPQRLGDRMAGTLVVTSVTSPGSSSAS